MFNTEPCLYNKIHSESCAEQVQQICHPISANTLLYKGTGIIWTVFLRVVHLSAGHGCSRSPIETVHQYK